MDLLGMWTRSPNNMLVRNGDSMKVDILYGREQKPCMECGDPWGTIFAVNGGICTTIMCFQCITLYLNNDGFES